MKWCMLFSVFFVLFVYAWAIFLAWFFWSTGSTESDIKVPSYLGPRDAFWEDVRRKQFKLSVSDKIIFDLHRRLQEARPYESLPIQQEYGVNSAVLKQLAESWRNNYNWTDRQNFLNKFPQFTIRIDGLRIHYLHVKPSAKDKNERTNLKVLPLLMLHGWPSSVREFYEMIPEMTRPRKGFNFLFEVIVPSLPGYGFSEPAAREGLTAVRTAVLLHTFMGQLGHKNFYVHGSGGGGIIAQYMASLYPMNIKGLHSTFCLVYDTSLTTIIRRMLYYFGPKKYYISLDEELQIKFNEEKYPRLFWELGTVIAQATAPDTFGIVFNESPLGLAAFILDKFAAWTNPNWKQLNKGGLERFNMTSLLDNIMIYWVTRSISTSMRITYETLNDMDYFLSSYVIEVPSACARFSHDLVYPLKFILNNKFKNLLKLTDYKGGHFATLETPTFVASDIFHFVHKVLYPNQPTIKPVGNIIHLTV